MIEDPFAELAEPSKMTPTAPVASEPFAQLEAGPGVVHKQLDADDGFAGFDQEPVGEVQPPAQS